LNDFGLSLKLCFFSDSHFCTVLLTGEKGI
jgi:hypothetical protein